MFVASLARNIGGARDALNALERDPTASGVRGELRRRLHALNAAARLLCFEAMARRLAQADGELECAAESCALEAEDVGRLAGMLDELPGMAESERAWRGALVPSPPAPGVEAERRFVLVLGGAALADALTEEAERHGSVAFDWECTTDLAAAADTVHALAPDVIVLDADLPEIRAFLEALVGGAPASAPPVIAVGELAADGPARAIVAEVLPKPLVRADLWRACEPLVAAPGGDASAAHRPAPTMDGGGAQRAPRVAEDVSLAGRSVLVADDDPNITWLFADMLQAAACLTHEASDGSAALELAARYAPELVLCDILMPSIDGFTLCRTLKRDVALRDRSVLLLSWREDLLQRARELGAGADGYFRKESDAHVIVAHARHVLRPRAQLEWQLLESADVDGGLERLSVCSLLELVCRLRPDARIAVDDVSFHYEIEVRDGAPACARQIGLDGTVLTGERVLASMLGIGAGRFVVSPSGGPVPSQLSGSLHEQLTGPVARARGAAHATTGARMMHVAEVTLDDAVLEGFLQATPEPMQGIIRMLADGASPHQMLVGGNIAPRLLEDVLADLAGRGAITGVRSIMGEDLLTPAIDAALEWTQRGRSASPHAALEAPSAAGPQRAARASAERSLGDTRAGGHGERVDPGGAPTLGNTVMRTLGGMRDRATALGVGATSITFVEGASLRPRATPPPVPVIEVVGEGPLALQAEVNGSPEPPIYHFGALAHDRAPADALAENNDSEGPWSERTPAPADPGGSPDEADPFVLNDPRTTFPSALGSHGGGTLPYRPSGIRVARRSAWALWWPLYVAVAVVLLAATVLWATGWRALSRMPPRAERREEPSGGKLHVRTAPLPAGGAAIGPDEGMIEVRGHADAEVRIDGTPRGRGPRLSLPVAAGAHEVRIVRAAGELAESVQVRAGALTSVDATEPP